MRLYSITNMYTSGIHAGIQTAHAVHEMQRKYEKRGPSTKLDTYNKWADDHKTIVVLNGGYHSALDDLYRELTEWTTRLELPLIKWKESKEALNGATTAVALVVPREVYGIKKKVEDLPVAGWATDAEELYRVLKRFPLAS